MLLDRLETALRPVATGLRVLGLLGAALLLAATVLPVLRYPPPPEFREAFDLARTGWERTAIVLPALALLGVLGLAARDAAARMGAIAVALAGLVAVGVAVLVDRPGAAPVLTVGRGGVTSSLAPGSGPGWYLEAAGGVLLLAVGLALLLLAARAGRADRDAGTSPGGPRAPQDASAGPSAGSGPDAGPSAGSGPDAGARSPTGTGPGAGARTGTADGTGSAAGRPGGVGRGRGSSRHA